MATSRKTHEEWFVGVRFKSDNDRGEKVWRNAINWWPSAIRGQRYASSKEQARKILDFAIKKWNGVKAYNANGERIETDNCGGFGVDLVCTRETDESLTVVKYILRKRRVTDWEVIEEK